MPAAENQRLVYRDKFRSLHYEEFQSWFEELASALHPVGDFLATRNTQGDGGLDGHVINLQLVYAVYAPARRKDDRDSETAKKIRSDFAKAWSTLNGQLKAWVFIHNHPAGKLGKRGNTAINDLKSQHPSVEITVLNIDGLWKKLTGLADETLKRFFGEKDAGATPQLRRAEENIPADIQALLVEASDLAHEGRDAAAKEKYELALKRAEDAKHPLACIKAKVGIATIVGLDDFAAARELFRECLDELKLTPSESERAKALRLSGNYEVLAGNLIEGKALLSESLTLSRQLDDREGIASCLFYLATLADKEGQPKEAEKLLDDATKLFVAEYQRHDAKTEKRAARSVAACHHKKSHTCKRRGDLVSALTSLELSVEWFQKSGSKDGLARALFDLAEAKCGAGEWQASAQTLNEAKGLFQTVGDFFWVSECLDLFGRIHYTLGNREEAVSCFMAAFSLLKEKGTPREIVPYLFKLARVLPEMVTNAEIADFSAKLHKIADEVKDQAQLVKAVTSAAEEDSQERQSEKKRVARELLDESKRLCEQHHLLEQLADSELALADLEENEERQSKARRFALETLKTLLTQTQLKNRQAFLMGRIGSLHQGLAEWDEALDWFTHAKDIFETTGDVGGVANCYASLAEIRREQNQPQDELDAYRQLLTVVQGKHFPDLIARAKINMGRRLMFSGHLQEAKRLFEDSRRLCNKHSIEEIAPALRRNFEELRLRIRAQKPPELSFAQLFDELHELAAWFPEAKKAFLPFWYYCRDAEIWGNTRSLHGVKLLVFEDNVAPFLQLADRLSAFGDLFLQVFSSPFPEPDHFVVPFPKEKIIPARVAIVRKLAQPDGSFALDCVQGSMHSPYHFHRDEMQSESTGSIGITISARDKFGPDCAYELMMDRTSEELIRRRVLFFPYERHRADDKCLADLELATDLGLLPVYPSCIPQSDEVEVLRGGQAELAFPLLSQQTNRAAHADTTEVKRKLLRLLSLKDQEAVAALTELADNLDELRVSTGASECIRMTAYLLRSPVHGAVQTHLALVRHEK